MKPSKNRFTFTIHDDDGEISIHIEDHLTKYHTDISPEHTDGMNVEPNSIIALAKHLVTRSKEKFRSVANVNQP